MPHQAAHPLFQAYGPNPSSSSDGEGLFVVCEAHKSHTTKTATSPFFLKKQR
jgi:hypothetical protein